MIVCDCHTGVFMKLGRTGWNKNDFIRVVAENASITDVLVELGADTRKCRERVLYYIVKLALDTSHFTKYPIGRFESWRTKIPLEDILVENSTYTSISSLKRRLLRVGLIENKCCICRLVEWQGKSITLQLDHINGNHYDHRLENIRMLCPNCHVQQETSHGKRLKGRKRKNEDEYIKYFCLDCGKEVFGYKSKLCRDCFYKKVGKNYSNPWPDDQMLIDIIIKSNMKQAAIDLGISQKRLKTRLKNRKLIAIIKSHPEYKPYAQDTVINWPNFDVLIEMVNNNGYIQAAKMLGVSPNAVKVRIKRAGFLDLINLKKWKKS